MITKDQSSQFLTIKIRNPNPENKPVFLERYVKAMFNFSMQFGSKQDMHTVSRGTLGDAMKESVAFPHAMINANNENNSATFGKRH
jgi:hypothetical protein